MSYDLSQLQLSFVSHTWPLARVTGPITVVIKEHGQRLGSAKALEIEARGKPRPVVQTTARAFFRNFVAADFLSNVYATEDFIKRKGEPLGTLSPEVRSTDTAEWPKIAEALRPLAQLWGPIEDDGVSRCRANRAAIGTALERLLEHSLMHPPGFVLYLDAFAEPGSLVVQAKLESLANYMAASAAILAHARADMRACERCADFFVPARSDARFCSSGCRTAASVARAHDNPRGRGA